MKRLAYFITSLFLLSSVITLNASAVDLSGLSNSQLLELKTDIEKELYNRGDGNAIVLTNGIKYTVGSSIESGIYDVIPIGDKGCVFVADSYKTFVKFVNDGSPVEKMSDYGLEAFLNESIDSSITLIEGKDLIISGGTFVFYKREDLTQLNEPTNESIEIETEMEFHSSNDGVSEEFKARIATYEKFFDDCGKTLEAVSNGSSDLTVLMSYATLLADYSKMLQELKNIENEELTDAERKYYLEFLIRLEQKMVDFAF